MSEERFQVAEIERILRRFPGFMDPCVVEQGLIIRPKRAKQKPPAREGDDGR